MQVIAKDFDKYGLLMVGHGTRSERGQREFGETVEMLARRLPQTEVRGCYLELAEPTIAEALASLAARGCRRIVVQPLLLFAAGHAREDLPAAVREAARTHPGLDIVQAAHLGCDERLLALSAERYVESFAGEEDHASAGDTLWLMVGRGAREASALAELARFVALRQRSTPVGQVRIAYLAMSEPRLEQVLPEIAALRFRRVVVQPHLLFHGELVTLVAERVAEVAKQWPGQEWRVCTHLGPSAHLVETLAERYFAAVFPEPSRR
jgi:sirohydrochlorin cobaltochelatase